MPTIGQKLEETRVSRGLSIEDVAHETRIHPNMLLRIEEDDFSHFPSVAYAKSFVRKYGHHLGLDLGDAMESLDVGVTRIGENELMGEVKRTIHKDRLFHLERTRRLFRRRRPVKRGSPLFLNFVLATLMAALGLFYFLGYNAPSAQKAREEITRGIARGIGIDLPPAAEKPAPDSGSSLATNVASPASSVEPNRTDPPPNSGQAEAGTSPIYPPIKEAIDLKFEDDLPLLPAGTAPERAPSNNLVDSLPRPRETPRLVLTENPVSPPGGNVPSATTRKVEPQPVLRPAGTNPSASLATEPSGSASKATEETSGIPSEQGSEDRKEPDVPAPTSPPRAVPVTEAR